MSSEQTHKETRRGVMNGILRSAEVERQRRELVIDILVDELAQVRSHRDSLVADLGRMPYPSDVDSAEVEANIQRTRFEDLLAACSRWRTARQNSVGSQATPYDRALDAEIDKAFEEAKS